MIGPVHWLASKLYTSVCMTVTAALHFLAQSELVLLAVLTCKYNTSNTNACAVEQEAVGDVDALKLANEHLELTLQRCATRADREVTSLRTALEAAQTEAEEVRDSPLMLLLHVKVIYNTTKYIIILCRTTELSTV
jgi:hypothetical protein